MSLAVSLHAPNDELRNVLVPINKKYNIDTLFAATQRYLDALPDNRSVTFEYTMLDGVNDQLEHANQLARLIKKTGIRCKVNLIPSIRSQGRTTKPVRALLLRLSNENWYIRTSSRRFVPRG